MALAVAVGTSHDRQCASSNVPATHGPRGHAPTASNIGKYTADHVNDCARPGLAVSLLIARLPGSPGSNDRSTDGERPVGERGERATCPGDVAGGNGSGRRAGIESDRATSAG